MRENELEKQLEIWRTSICEQVHEDLDAAREILGTQKQASSREVNAFESLAESVLALAIGQERRAQKDKKPRVGRPNFVKVGS